MFSSNMRQILIRHHPDHTTLLVPLNVKKLTTPKIYRYVNFFITGIKS